MGVATATAQLSGATQPATAAALVRQRLQGQNVQGVAGVRSWHHLLAAPIAEELRLFRLLPERSTRAAAAAAAAAAATASTSRATAATEQSAHPNFVARGVRQRLPRSDVSEVA